MVQVKRKHIFLTGFMGSGKSTIGPVLAQALGFGFVDLDEEIESREEQSIEEIFQVAGEPHFRSLERQYLQRFIEERSSVFALGGGTVTIEGLLQDLKRNGILVYLKTDAEELVARLQGHTHRPLLRGKDGRSLSEVELHKRIDLLLQERIVYYRQADIIIETTRQPVETVLESVLKALAGILHNNDSRTI